MEGKTMKDKKYFIRMKSVTIYVGIRTTESGHTIKWVWDIVTYNGHIIQRSKYYDNKAQCRNVGKPFAESSGYEWKE